ncbi:MAG: HigA family addiction module antidote protein [Marinosulfonomonas sp.]|nr:HigA family addiction module antidote protein [Marinosulfonomonas sp.]
MSLVKNPSHPGEVLYTLYLVPLEMSAITLARRLNLPRTRIERLIKGTTGMSPDTAFRLAHFFGTTPQFWMNMQINYDIAHTKVDFSKIEPLSA